MPKRLEDLNVDEISLVTSPANKQARVSLFKRDSSMSTPIEKADREGIASVCKMMLEDGITDFREALSQEMRNQRVMDLSESIMPLVDALRESVITSAADLEGEDREAKIRENVEQFLSAVREEVGTTSIENGSDIIEAADDSAGASGEPTSKSGDSDMADDDKTRLDALEKQVSSLVEQVQSHGLEVSKADDGSYQVSKKADDEVITDPDGNTIRKSDVSAEHFQAMKSMRERLDKMESERQRESLAKQAEARWPSVSGDAMTKGDILGAIQGIENETARNAALEKLDALEQTTAKQFDEVGKGGSPDMSEPMEKLEKLASERAEQSGVSKEQAFSEVLKTDQGAKLYEQHIAKRAS